MTRVPDSWVQGALAVNAFDRLCIEHKWPWVSAGDRDFGKDGYVDISDDDGSITGETFFVQIKGGRSFAAPGGYRIPVGNHMRPWRDSPVAVVGIVHDPADQRLRWVNLTHALKDNPTQASIHVPADALLETPEQLAALRASVRPAAAASIPLGIASSDIDEQAAAVWEAFALGHMTPAPLIALRRSFLAFEPGAARYAAHTLSLCTPHPDIFWTKQSWLPPAIQTAVASTYRWSVHEAWQLLSFVDAGPGMQRGTLGQCILMLLLEDPNRREIIDRVIDITDDSTVLFWAAAVALFLARDQAATHADELERRRPDLALSEPGSVLLMTARHDGSVFLM